MPIPGHKGNANQNHTKIPSHSYKNGYHQEHHQQQMLTRILGKRNAHTVLVGKYNHFRKQYGVFLKNQAYICHKIQQHHS
jgi:hypothetical protein